MLEPLYLPPLTKRQYVCLSRIRSRQRDAASALHFLLPGWLDAGISHQCDACIYDQTWRMAHNQAGQSGIHATWYRPRSVPIWIAVGAESAFYIQSFSSPNCGAHERLLRDKRGAAPSFPSYVPPSVKSMQTVSCCSSTQLPPLLGSWRPHSHTLSHGISRRLSYTPQDAGRPQHRINCRHKLTLVIPVNYGRASVAFLLWLACRDLLSLYLVSVVETTSPQKIQR